MYYPPIISQPQPPSSLSLFQMSLTTRRHVCFVMFVDKPSFDALVKDGPPPDSEGRVGLWRIVMVTHLPYSDPRKSGKVPKLLTHRLFPNAKYSMWVDSKLRLAADPLLVFDKFLWREGNEFAISQHYDRQCVWEEVMESTSLDLPPVALPLGIRI